MELYGYMLRMARLIPKLSEINKDMIELLSLFVFNQHLSIYQIHKMVNNMMKVILIELPYKNTHKKVQRLVKLKLIERVTDTSVLQERELERGAKYYKLSEEGIFTLFQDSSLLAKPPHYYASLYMDKNLNPETTIDYMEQAIDIATESENSKAAISYRKEIYQHHRNCALFRIFLSPWISIDTIEKLDKDTIDKIRLFLTGCCNNIKDRILIFSKGIFHSKGYYHVLGTLHLIETNFSDFNELKNGINNVNDNKLLSLIGKTFSLGTEIVRIEKESKKQIILYNSYNKKLFQLDYRENEMELEILSVDDNSDKISLPIDPNKGIVLPITEFDSIVNQIDLPSLCFNAVFSTVIEKHNGNGQDLLLLKHDKSFMNTMFELNTRFHTVYDMMSK